MTDGVLCCSVTAGGWYFGGSDCLWAVGFVINRGGIECKPSGWIVVQCQPFVKEGVLPPIPEVFVTDERSRGTLKWCCCRRVGVGAYSIGAVPYCMIIISAVSPKIHIFNTPSWDSFWSWYCPLTHSAIHFGQFPEFASYRSFSVCPHHSSLSVPFAKKYGVDTLCDVRVISGVQATRCSCRCIVVFAAAEWLDTKRVGIETAETFPRQHHGHLTSLHCLIFLLWKRSNIWQRVQKVILMCILQTNVQYCQLVVRKPWWENDWRLSRNLLRSDVAISAKNASVTRCGCLFSFRWTGYDMSCNELVKSDNGTWMHRESPFAFLMTQDEGPWHWTCP